MQYIDQCKSPFRSIICYENFGDSKHNYLLSEIVFIWMLMSWFHFYFFAVGRSPKDDFSGYEVYRSGGKKMKKNFFNFIRVYAIFPNLIRFSGCFK